MRAETGYHGGTYGTGRLAALLVVCASFGNATAWAQDAFVTGVRYDSAHAGGSVFAPVTEFEQFECGCRSRQYWLDEVHSAVARGEIADPATRVIPPIQRGRLRERSATIPCLSPAHIFAFEDTNQVLLTNYSTGQLIDLLADAANALMATHGDIYDFVGVWLNFAAHHEIGSAAYLSLENDVAGIGVPGGVEPAIFNVRADLGIGGQNIEGMLITWNINLPKWQPGSGPEAFFTRVALGHELDHRFAMFLPDLLDGRRMQGFGGFGCYVQDHPNPSVDAQGSFLGLGEWVGSNPAVIQSSFPDFFRFNSDTGGSYSYLELYLMGYVSPAEMDAGMSELRYMDNWNCVATDYFGSISTISSADIIAAAGPRIPDSTAEDKHYRLGWIMIHLPGDPPNVGQRAKAVAIHEQLQIDWNFSTLGRGTMDNSLFDDCNCNDIPDVNEIAGGSSLDCNANGTPDECEYPGCPGIVLADLNCDGAKDGTDIQAFVDQLVNGTYTCQADMDQNGILDSLDLPPFVSILLAGP